MYCGTRQIKSDNPFTVTENKNIKTISLDVSDADQVSTVLNKIKPQVIFHLAALPAGDRSAARLPEQVRVTFGGTVNVAQAILQLELDLMPLLVHVGSSEEYGGGAIPFKEDQMLAPISPYSAAKASCSQFLIAEHQAFNLPVIITRPSVVYGPGQASGMVIPYLFSSYLSGKAPALSPGEQTRDFVYVDDCIEALSILGLRPDLAGQIFNLGSSTESKLKDVAEKIAMLCRYEGATGIGDSEYRKAEVMRHKECCQKASEHFGWQAVTDIDSGLSKTYQWWHEQKAQLKISSQANAK